MTFWDKLSDMRKALLILGSVAAGAFSIGLWVAEIVQTPTDLRNRISHVEMRVDTLKVELYQYIRMNEDLHNAIQAHEESLSDSLFVMFSQVGENSRILCWIARRVDPTSLQPRGCRE